MEITDQLGRKIFFHKTPVRIISLVPSLTELLVDLGLESQLVGVTKFCVHPKSLREQKTVVGGTKTVYFDQISALKPDIILCNKEENTLEIVAACSRIAPVHISDINNLEECYEVLQQYGKIFNISSKTDEFTLKIRQKAQKFKEIPRPEKAIKVAYLIWRKPYMVAGSITFIDFLLKMNGFENIFDQKPSRYPVIQPEELKDADLVMLSSEPFPFKQKHITELSSATSAKFLLVDGEYFSWYGSRLLGAFDYFENLQKKITSTFS